MKKDICLTKQGQLQQGKTNIKDIQTNIFVFIIYFYALCSEPFIFLIYLPFPLRIFLLFIPLLFIGNALRLRRPVNPKIYLIIWLLLSIPYALNQLGVQPVIIKTFITFSFLISLLSLKRYIKFNGKLVVWWFWLWVYISLSVIGLYVAYVTKIVSFSLFDFSTISENSPYIVQHHPLLGNYFKYSLLGFHVPKISWYSFEPGILSYFFGFNVLLAAHLQKVSLSSKKIFIFKYLNMTAGFLTFSSAYMLFLLYFIPTSFFPSFKKSYLFHIVIISIFGLILINTITMDVLATTSAGDRLLRLENAINALGKSDFFDFLFGSGTNISTIVSDRGFSSGLLSIFIERGAFIFAFISIILYKYTHGKREILFYIFFYLITIEQVWTPMFAIGLAVAYNCQTINRPQPLTLQKQRECNSQV